MNVQVAVLCDAATDDNGKLNLLGAFDTICARELPAVHPQCSVAVRLTFFSGEEGRHTLRVNFVNADGRSIMPDFPTIPVDIALPGDTHFATRNFILNIQHLKFEEPGPYSVELIVDDQVQTSIPLMIKLMTPETPPLESD